MDVHCWRCERNVMIDLAAFPAELSHISRRLWCTCGERRCRARSRLAADKPAHRRIVPRAFDVVDIFIPRKPPERGLPQQPDQRMAAVPAGAGVSERAARHHTEAGGVVEFAIGQQARIGDDDGAAKLER